MLMGHKISPIVRSLPPLPPGYYYWRISNLHKGALGDLVEAILMGNSLLRTWGT
jgi:hypothetical protein